MQRLAVLRDDRRERHALTVRLGDALDRAGYLALDHARTAHLHGRGVHAVSDLEGALQGLDLLGALALAHLRHGEHQIERLALVQHRQPYAQQLGEHYLRLAAIWRQIVHRAVQRYGRTQHAGQLLHGMRLLHARLGGHFAQRGLRSRPYDILDREVVAEEHLLARVGIDHTRYRRHVKAEEVAERRVLTEVVCVVGIVVRRIGIAGQQDKAAADTAAQLGAPCDIGLFTEHGYMF